MADDETTIENRVYLFRDLAGAWLGAHGARLASRDPAERNAARGALAEIARVSCEVADGAERSPDEVAERIRRPPSGQSGIGHEP